jgi:hypothetical protein
MQQDAVAMRMTMRLAYATVNPVTVMSAGRTITQRWPFGAVLGVGTTAPTAGPITVIQSYPGGTRAVTATGDEVGEDQTSQWEQDAQQAREDALNRRSEESAEDESNGGTGRTSRTRRSTPRDKEE